MQIKTQEIPFHKLLRTNVPVKNWCKSKSQYDEADWTLERCIEEASRFSARDQWEQESPVSYLKATKKGWLTKCSLHMKGFAKKRVVKAKWTMDRCIEVSRKCQSKSEFNERFRYAYEKARLNGWLNACCAHMQ